MWDNKYIIETKETLSELGVKNSNVKLAKKGSLLFSFKLTVWRMSFAWIDLYTNEAIAAFEPNEILDLNYLYYILPYIANQVDRTNNYWAPLLNKSVISNLQIPLPPLATQKLIVAKLDEAFTSLDESIRLTKENIIRLDEVTRSILDKILKKNVWPIKKLWEIYSEIKIWWTPSREKKEYFWWWLLWVSIRDMWDNKYITETKETLSESWVKNSNVKLVKKGSLLFSFKLTVWRMSFAACDLYTNEAIASFEPNEKLNLNYLYYILPYIANQVDRTNNYWAPLLNKSVISNLQIPLPPLSKQQEIVSYLDQVFAKTKQLKAEYEVKLQQLKELKSSILQSAFEGKLI